jgi:hypothetical protein
MTRRYYQIHIAESLSKNLAQHFRGLTMVCRADDGVVLIGPLEDQAALHGILNRIRDLGLTLVKLDSVTLTPGPTVPFDHARGDEQGDCNV